jgi:hypothetical protein
MAAPPLDINLPLTSVFESASISSAPQPTWSTKPKSTSSTTVGTTKANIAKKSKDEPLTPEEIEDYWNSAFKSALSRLPKAHLYQILSTKSPNTCIKSEALKPEILNEIQRLVSLYLSVNNGL